jgi:esterase/lipase superfamily enzyme
MMRYLILILCALFAAPPAARAGIVDPAFSDDRQEMSAAPQIAESQLWLVSTRRLPHGPVNSARRLLPDVSRYEPSGWQPASHDWILPRSDKRLKTVIVVHGNDTDDPTARSRGLAMYQSLAQSAGQPFRLIVWSWPADAIPGTWRQDVRVKAERADSDSYYLAQFISDVESPEPVHVVGYSLGARVIAGGLHLLGGGSLAGRAFDSHSDRSRAPIHTVLMAAALDDDGFLPGRRYGRAMSVVDRMVLLVNPQDRVLRWYRFLSPGNGATALGAGGIASPGSLGQLRQKVEQVNVNSYVGGQHGWSSYASSPQILEQLKRQIFARDRNDDEPLADSTAAQYAGDQGG